MWWFATRYILMALGVEAETLELAVFYIRVLVLYLWPQLMQRAMISILSVGGRLVPLAESAVITPTVPGPAET